MPPRLLTIGTLALALLGLLPAAAQPYAPCGVVDAIDYPIDISDTLTAGYDDFALFRNRFGGNHVGIDIGFNRLGEPVYAAARGRVTYSNPEGWDTEKGVVILEHVFPDGSIIYSLYGHLEEDETTRFPAVGACVERGMPLGVIGWPSRGLPHLHYEIRNFMPSDGGPGYVLGNPQHEGWFHPLDFTILWNLRLAPAYLNAVTFTSVPTLPPVVLDSGVIVIASGSAIEGFIPPGQRLWRITADEVVTGLIGLPGDRAIARTRSGQTLALRGGRYVGVWSIPGPDAPLLAFDDAFALITENGGIAAYSVDGEHLWALPPGLEPAAVSAGFVSAAEAQVGLGLRVLSFEQNGEQMAAAVRVDDAVHWRVVGRDGTLIYETQFERTPVVAAAPGGGWRVLDGATIYAVERGERRELGRISPVPGRTAAMAVDPVGNMYIYVGDPQATLLAIGAMGEPRWRIAYPFPATTLPPLLAAGGGCLLYSLDADGVLNAFDAANGELVAQRHLYAGGNRNSSPRSRLLWINGREQLLVSSGFLTTVALDGAQLAPAVLANCRLG